MIWVILGKIALLGVAFIIATMTMGAGGLCEKEPRHVGKWGRFAMATIFLSIAFSYIAGAI